MSIHESVVNTTRRVTVLNVGILLTRLPHGGGSAVLIGPVGRLGQGSRVSST